MMSQASSAAAAADCDSDGARAGSRFGRLIAGAAGGTRG